MDDGAAPLVDPRCRTGEYLFLSSEGWFLPCCYVHLLLRRSLADPARVAPEDRWFLDNLDLFDVGTRSVAEVATDPRWQGLVRAWSGPAPPRPCLEHCGRSRPRTGGPHDADRTVEPLVPAEADGHG
jgi:hypothetical protein